MRESNNANWVSIMSNPQGHVIKQYMSEILKEKFGAHIEILERLSRTLITQGDMQAFGQLVSEIYQTGYFKAIKEHEDLLTKLGYKIGYK